MMSNVLNIYLSVLEALCDIHTFKGTAFGGWLWHVHVHRTNAPCEPRDSPEVWQSSRQGIYPICAGAARRTPVRRGW